MLDFLFGNKKKKESEAGAKGSSSAAAPGTHISYSPTLVSELKDDHQVLLDLFGQISAAHAAGDLGQTAQLLDRFRSLLGEHLLKENVRFYIYLEHALKKDQASHELVHQFRREMDGIGKNVMAFLKRYRHIDTDRTLTGTFEAELKKVGEVLQRRIASEEGSLYSLYLPSY